MAQFVGTFATKDSKMGVLAPWWGICRHPARRKAAVKYQQCFKFDQYNPEAAHVQSKRHYEQGANIPSKASAHNIMFYPVHPV